MKQFCRSLNQLLAAFCIVVLFNLKFYCIVSFCGRKYVFLLSSCVSLSNKAMKSCYSRENALAKTQYSSRIGASKLCLVFCAFKRILQNHCSPPTRENFFILFCLDFICVFCKFQNW